MLHESNQGRRRGTTITGDVPRGIQTSLTITLMDSTVLVGLPKTSSRRVVITTIMVEALDLNMIRNHLTGSQTSPSTKEVTTPATRSQVTTQPSQSRRSRGAMAITSLCHKLTSRTGTSVRKILTTSSRNQIAMRNRLNKR